MHLQKSRKQILQQREVTIKKDICFMQFLTSTLIVSRADCFEKEATNLCKRFQKHLIVKEIFSLAMRPQDATSSLAIFSTEKMCHNLFSNLQLLTGTSPRQRSIYPSIIFLRKFLLTFLRFCFLMLSVGLLQIKNTGGAHDISF